LIIKEPDVHLKITKEKAEVLAKGKNSPKIILTLSILAAIILLIIVVLKMDWRDLSKTPLWFVFGIFLIVLLVIYLLLKYLVKLQ